ncbi:MAG: hypothetical protein ACRCY4_09440 [Brevinema sp.]
MLYANRREYRAPESDPDDDDVELKAKIPTAKWDDSIASSFGDKLQYISADLSALESVYKFMPQHELDSRIRSLRDKAENMYIKKQLEEKDQQLKFLIEESKTFQQSMKNLEERFSKAAHSGSSPAASIINDQDKQQAQIDAHLTAFACHEPFARFAKHAQELGKVASVPTPKGKVFPLNETVDVINHMEKLYGTDYVLRSFYNNDNSLRQQANRILRTNHAK